MISKSWEIKHYCCEDISLIENYEEAMADPDNVWVIHHRFELDCPVYKASKKDLEDFGLYWNRPASELIFMKREDHQSLHTKGKSKSQSMKEKMSRPIRCIETGEVKSGIDWRRCGYDSARKVAAHLPRRLTCKGLHFEYVDATEND